MMVLERDHGVVGDSSWGLGGREVQLCRFERKRRLSVSAGS